MGDPVQILERIRHAAPLTIGAATVGRAAGGLDVVPGSLVPVTFAGRTSTTLAEGAPVLGDPLRLRVEPLTDLVVSVQVDAAEAIFCPPQMPLTKQALVENTDATGQERLEGVKCSFLTKPFVSAVDVLAPSRNVVVALGDSITDGMIDPASGDPADGNTDAHRRLSADHRAG